MEATLVEQPKQARSDLYSVTTETVSAKRDELLALKINGVGDEQGLAIVKAKLKEVVGWRTAVEAKRKELKSEYLEAGKRVDEVAKAIQAVIEPIERHLAGQKKLVDDELVRIENEKKQSIIRARQKRHTEAGGPPVGDEYLLSLSEPAFEVHIENVQAATAARLEAERLRQEQEAERKRQAAEEADRLRAERERLEADRAELRRLREEADEQKRQVEADRQAVENQRLENDRASRALAEQVAAPAVTVPTIPVAVSVAPVPAPAAERYETRTSAVDAGNQKLLYEFACSIRLLIVPKVGDEIEIRVNELLCDCSDAILNICQGMN